MGMASFCADCGFGKIERGEKYTAWQQQRHKVVSAFQIKYVLFGVS